MQHSAATACHANSATSRETSKICSSNVNEATLLFLIATSNE